MPIGAKILDGLDAAIRLHEKVLLILSENSITSGWVEDEVSKAFAEERKRGHTVLFPVRLDDAVMDTCEAWAVKATRPAQHRRFPALKRSRWLQAKLRARFCATSNVWLDWTSDIVLKAANCRRVAALAKATRQMKRIVSPVYGGQLPAGEPDHAHQVSPLQ